MLTFAAPTVAGEIILRAAFYIGCLIAACAIVSWDAGF